MQKIPPLVPLRPAIKANKPLTVLSRCIQVQYVIHRQNYIEQESVGGYYSLNDSADALNTNFELIAAQNADLKTRIETLNQENEKLRAAIAQNNTQTAEMKTALAATSSRLDAFQQQMQTFSERIGALMTAIPNAVRTMTHRLVSVYAAVRAGALDALEFADDAQEIV